MRKKCRRGRTTDEPIIFLGYYPHYCNMQLTSRFKIRQIKSIIRFLNENNVGRISTIDTEGFPQIIPMNFVCAPDFSGNINLNNGDGGGDDDIGKAAAAAAPHQKEELEGEGGKKGGEQGSRNGKSFSGSHA